VGSDFTVVIRGYDRGQVDATLAEAERLRESGQVDAVRELLAGKRFAVVLRGYDRGQVDAHLEALASR
jgi:DivIVA domain-containing protein